MNKLMKFMTAHENEEIWLLLPSGLVQGRLSSLESDTPETIDMTDVIQFVGDITADIGEATIFLNQIIGWGDTIPTFNDKEDL